MTGKGIYKLLADNGLTVGFAESMTGGLASYKIVENPGASKVLRGSLVTYNESVKYDILGINYRFMETHGIVSEPVAIAMAESVRMELSAGIGVGITGNAGPTLQEGVSGKMAYVSVTDGRETICEHISFDLESRIEAIEKTVSLSYRLIEKIILKN